MNKETLRQFNAILVDDKNAKHEITVDLAKRCFLNGYVLDLAIPIDKKTLHNVEEIVGISGEKANASFHKSWGVVKNSPIEVLVFQQIIHYLTTYGFEFFGIYDDSTVYIPVEKLEIPELKNDLPLVYIKAFDKDDLKKAVMDLVSSGIALHEETLKDLIVFVEKKVVDFSKNLDEIKNREFKIICRDFYNVVPTDPTEFFRYVISKLTNESLVIKNKALIEKIKNSNGKFLEELMSKAPDDLASIFLRYKPLFLAMKSISKNKRFYNQLRKKAVTMHKPLPIDYLNSVTSQIKRNELDLKKLENRLEKATIWRKIRLAYALNNRLHACDSTVIRVRNGKLWVDEFDWPENLDVETTFDLVVNSIAKNIRKNVEGKIFYIPEYVKYALPATEKQFVGVFPMGTSIAVCNNMIVGVHWADVEGCRVDLDLSLMTKNGKYGWDAYYRSAPIELERDIMFSGDVVSAPLPTGASELFYMESVKCTPKLVFVNYFNMHSNDEKEVSMKILVASEQPKNFSRNYMVNPNNILAQTIVNITKQQNTVGLVVGNIFYFYYASIGNSRSMRDSKRADKIRNFLVNSLVNSIDFNDVLRRAGAEIVFEKPLKEFINLSPEALDKNTIINIIK